MEEVVTIKTIASALNLSMTTVSRVLNGSSAKHRIAKQTQELVHTKAKELGYIPNMAAKTLRLNQSKTIGLLLPSLNNPFFSIVASTVSQSLYNQGYVVLMSDCNANPEEEKKMLQELLSQNLLGLLVIPSGNRKTFEFLSSMSPPTVFIDRFFSDLNICHVATDHYRSCYQLMEHLFQSGHTKIACIQGDTNVVSNRLRVDAYLDALRENDINYIYVAGDSFTTEEGYLETKLLLQHEDRPSAIIALSDTILLGVLRALKEEGLQIPQQISVVSIDNSAYLDFLEVPITSVSQPVTQIAQLATKLLLDLIRKPEKLNDTPKSSSILVGSTIIYRKSVKKIR